MAKSILQQFADYTRELLGVQDGHPATHMGFNSKKCKSCYKFKACHECKGRKMTDTACSNYKPKKRR